MASYRNFNKKWWGQTSCMGPHLDLIVVFSVSCELCFEYYIHDQNMFTINESWRLRWSREVLVVTCKVKLEMVFFPQIYGLSKLFILSILEKGYSTNALYFRMSEWVNIFFNANSAICHLYQRESKLIFNEMMMRSVLY